MKRLSIIKTSGGQSTVEFALILPVLLLIILGVLEFGLFFSSRIIITSAAREGARVYAITKNDELAEAAIIDSAAFVYERALDFSILAKTDYLESSEETIEMATIQIDAKLNNVIGFFLSNPFEISAIASMRLEYVE